MLHARAVIDLAEALDGEVEDAGGTRLLAEIELPLVHVLAEMEQTGIAVDIDHLEQLESHFAAEVRQAADEAYAVIGKEINLGSPKQLQVVLFDELDMPKTKRTKTGYTTDADALQAALRQDRAPVPAAPAATPRRGPAAPDHRGAAQDGGARRPDPHDVQPDDRRHRPALQHRPQPPEHPDPHRGGPPDPRGVRGRAIRAPSCLMTADYSQIEMRIMAHLSEDELLIEAFRSGRDFHSITAARVFDVAADDVTVEMRAKIKAMNYGLAYGLSAFGLGQQLRIEPGEARGLMDEYFETFGGIRDYLGGVVDEARKTGFTETIWGRRRYLPDLTSDNRMRPAALPIADVILFAERRDHRRHRAPLAHGQRPLGEEDVVHDVERLQVVPDHRHHRGDRVSRTSGSHSASAIEERRRAPRQCLADRHQVVARIKALGDRADRLAQRLAVAQEGRTGEDVDLRRRRR